MSFAVPAALFLTAVALPIIGLYILKVRLRRVKVSTNLFWKQVYEEKPPRSLWQNLRHLLSLLAQLLLLLLLVSAIADPYFFWQALQARRIVAVIDISASMKAQDVSPSRFEAARTAVHRVLDGLRFRDEMAIVSAGGRPEVILGMASHVPTLRRAIDGIEPVDTSASLDAAIELATQLIGDHPHGQIIVFSDGCAQRPSDVVTTTQLAGTEHSTEVAQKSAVDPGAIANSKPKQIKPQVIHKTFATTAPNVGITQFQARRSLVDPLGYEILVTVRNASKNKVSGRLELELDEIPVDIIPINLKPEEVWTRSFEKTSLEGGVLKSALTQLAIDDANFTPGQDSDGTKTNPAAPTTSSAISLNVLPTDDVAFAIVPARKVQNVLIVTPGNLFLRKVFEANPLVNISTSQEIPKQWPKDTIVVLHRLIPEILPIGPLLIVDPETNSDVWSLGELIENPIVTEQDDESPLMTHIRLDNVLMPEAKKMEFSLPVSQLAATVTGETVYASVQRPSGPCLVLSINLEKSDLAFRTAFPILIANALGWFAGQPSEHQPSLAGGQIAEFDPSNARIYLESQTESSVGDNTSESPSGVGRATDSQTKPPTQASYRHFVKSPTGKQIPLMSRQIGPMSEVGIWEVQQQASDALKDRQSRTTDSAEAAGTVVERFAINLANANESDLRPSDQFARSSDSSISSNWLSRPLWYYLIVCASFFCTAEWYLYQRRFIS